MIATLPISEEALGALVSPLHVLTLTPFYPSGKDGARGSFVAEPLTHLHACGVRNTVIAVEPFYRTRPQPTNIPPIADWIGYPSLRGRLGLPVAGTGLFARVWSKLRRLHQRDPVHVLHAHSALPCGQAAYLASRKLGVPFVVTVHGLDAFSTNQVPGYLGDCSAQLSRRVYEAAQPVICISEKVRERVMQGAPGAKASVVYNGVDPDLFHPAEEASDAAVILSVGNLIPTKGHELLLRAFAGIHHRFPGVCCEIIGHGPERRRLEDLVRKSGIGEKVRFLGQMDRRQVAQAMRRCMVFALPSSYEGLGCVYLEAMCTGKPVIACREQGISEVIQHNANGLLIPPGSLDELTAALVSLLENEPLRRQLGIAARQTILKRFTLSQQCERLSLLYRECVR